MINRAFNQPGHFSLPKSDAKHFGAKGGNARANTLVAVYMIEGESVTTTEIAARLGLAVSTTQKRIKASQRQPGPVTWQAIREAGK